MSIGSIKSWLKGRLALIISIIALLYASSVSYYNRPPYGFYQLLRFLVCGTGAYFSYKSAIQNRQVWAWILGIIAFLFNPVIPIHFNRETWQGIDAIVAVILFVFTIVPEKITKKWLKKASIIFGSCIFIFLVAVWMDSTIRERQRKEFLEKLSLENKKKPINLLKNKNIAPKRNTFVLKNGECGFITEGGMVIPLSSFLDPKEPYPLSDIAEPDDEIRLMHDDKTEIDKARNLFPNLKWRQ